MGLATLLLSLTTPITSDTLPPTNTLTLTLLMSHAASDQHADASRMEARERLRVAPLRDIPRLQTPLGQNRNVHRVDFDPELSRFVKPVSGIFIDFAHTFLIQGVVHFEMSCFLHALKEKTKFRYRHLDLFFNEWNWPTSERNPLSRILQTHAIGASSKREEARCCPCIGRLINLWLCLPLQMC